MFALVTVFFGYHASRLQIDASSEGLMLEHDPARAHYDRVKDTFGSDELTVIVIKADDVFTPAGLGAIHQLSESLQRIEGVARVDSLATVDNISATGDGLEIAPLLRDGVPADAAELATVRAKALGNPVFVGNLVSGDGRAAGVLVYTQPRADDKEFNARFTAAVDALIAEQARPGLTIYQVGAPLIKATYIDFIKRDQLTLVPLSATTLFVVLLIGFRTPQGVVAPLITGLSSVVWGVGLMALAGIPLNAVTVAVPSLVLVVGFAEAVHIISAYHRLLKAGHEKLHALSEAVEEAAIPITVTTATTVLAFATLILTDITMLIQFGYAAALALTANFAATLIGIPTLLRIWPQPRRFRTEVAVDPAAGDSAIAAAAADVILRYKRPIAAVFALLAVASAWGWYGLKVNTDFTSYFPENSEVRQRLRDADASLAGASAFFVVVDTGRENGVSDPAVLKQIAELQVFLEQIPGIDKAVSIADYVSLMHANFTGQPQERRVLPDSPDAVAQHLLVMDRSQTSRFLDLPGSSANIIVRHTLNGSWELSAAIRRLDAYTAERMRGLDVRATGQSVLTSRAADYMAVNELTSFIYTLIIIGIIHSVLFMSIKAGLLSLVPNVVPVLYGFGLMGLFDIPLSTGTAMVATVAIGIAVDDTVHNMVTYSRQLNLYHDQRVAVIRTLAIQGRPIVFISLALAAGFGVLAFSQFVPTVHLAIVSAFVMIAAMVSELVLAPILMSSTQLVTLWNMVLLKMNPALVRTAPLFEGLSTWEARKVVLMGGLRPLAPGEYAIRRGDEGRELFMVITGRVVVTDQDMDGAERTLAIVEPGGVFGETGILADGYRMSSARAELSSEVLRLDFNAFERLRKRFPYTAAKVFRNLAQLLGQRLQDTTTAMLYLSSAGKN